MSKPKIKYCALGEEGIEFVSDDENEVKAWIYDEIIGEGNASEPMPVDYYQIVTHTQAELDAMPEV